MNICLKLLDLNPKCLKDALEDYSARCNPIYVSRVVSAMVKHPINTINHNMLH